ncbi:hypothetical protein TorRG33x02_123930 [Trema orientale]|uniref:Uncharacterized protein n=1 Tax=Trema orientale TaxID=63057 RepID=A0A2P5F1Z5_TREOI|nr:hypothetical protein TorRG33x02_123930 [Trema orientale]
MGHICVHKVRCIAFGLVIETRGGLADADVAWDPTATTHRASASKAGRNPSHLSLPPPRPTPVLVVLSFVQ